MTIHNVNFVAFASNYDLYFFNFFLFYLFIYFFIYEKNDNRKKKNKIKAEICLHFVW